MFFKKDKYFNKNWKVKKDKRNNNLKKNNVYIKHYKFLKDNINVTNIFIKQYNKLKRKLNLKNKLTLNYKYITKKIMYIFKKPTREGKLKILNWRRKSIRFNFFYNKNIKDNKVYEFWNMNPSYIKYVYSKINRKHEFKDVYNLSYRSLIVFPYTIKVKPYTIIIKNLFIKRFLLIFEWKNKINKNLIVAKIAKKFNKILKFKLVKNIKYNSNNIYNKLFNMNIHSYIIRSYRPQFKIVAQNKIKYLFWVYENWLWRYRNNWVFTNSRREFSLNYQYYLLKIFKTRIVNKFNYIHLPCNIFIEKFENILYKKIIYLKKNVLLKLNNIKKFKINNYKFNRNKNYKYKDIYNNKYSLKTYKFYTNMYYIYYYWFILLLQKLYIYTNKIMFNMYLKFLYLSNYDNININYSFILFNNIKNLKNINILNIDSKIIMVHKKLNLNNIYTNRLYSFNYNIKRIDFISNLNKIVNNKNIFNYFKNLQYVYTKNIFNIIKNNKITLLLDYFQDSYYTISLCFKKYYIKTQRSIDFSLNERISKVNKFTYNQEYINLNKYNLNNQDIINIDVNKVYLDNINWFKINYNIDSLGYSLNINDLCYKNYDINIYEDKRFYYI